MDGGDRSFTDAEIAYDEMSELLFTSGTTGIAKGVMLSHKNICFDLMIAPTILNVNTWDIFFSVLPIHHTYEGTCGFLMPLYKGAAIAYCEGLKYIVKNLSEVRPTMFLGVPAIFEALYKTIWKNIKKQGKESAVKKVMAINKFTKKLGFDLNKKFLKDVYKVFGGRLRVIISGGAAIDPAILQFFNDLGFIAVQGYGLSECAPMGALNPDQHKYMRNASVGHILPGMQVKIADKDEDGIGEICLKGDNVMLGYYKNPEETAKVIKDGWFYTGDQGYTDEEDFIYITGRKKNVIIASNGKNVFPEELEYLLSKSPYVAESMVWGADDEKGDITIVASIRPDEEEVAEAIGEEKAKDDEAIKELLWKEVDRINADLPLFKKIKKISVRREEFEKNTSKKIKRFVEGNKKM
ncbi:MAG TPA: AMP-binding protein [Candidatus Fimisoma avicola]|uniref:AMP-binding protein n=1 Tax=Candidatus Fimisoma avicola TaxID=2840826 RepID=A0A9D1L8S9_9FIRM|nr:AMP-binding protein [Candidatus Fimisoma avicola]